MKLTRKLEHNLAVLLILPLLLMVYCAAAQSPANLAGSWQFNRDSSQLSATDIAYDGTIILVVEQTAATVSFSEIYKSAGNPDWSTSADVYNTNGKEEVTTSSIGTTRKTATWINSGTRLKIVVVDTQKLKGVSTDFAVEQTYSLTNGGKTLVVSVLAKNPVTGETQSKKVYNRI